MTPRGLWVLSLGSNEMLPLGYQPSPMTLCWSSRADLLFHYHRDSRSMERRHHYPSGLMRLSRCRKRSGNYCRCSFQPGDVTRAERQTGADRHTLCKGCITAVKCENWNLFPFTCNVESISEANKGIVDVLITFHVKESTTVTLFASFYISANKCNLVSFENQMLSVGFGTISYLTDYFLHSSVWAKVLFQKIKRIITSPSAIISLFCPSRAAGGAGTALCPSCREFETPVTMF